MKFTETVRFLLAAILVVASAQTRAADTFILTTRPLEIPERGSVTSLLVLTPARHYSFLPPPGWRYSPTPQRNEVSLQPPDFTATLTLRFEAQTTNRVPINPAQLHEQVLQQHPGAVFQRDFECYTSALKGHGTDFAWAVNRTNQVAMRVAVVPVERGYVEFKLTVLPGQLAYHNLLFGNLLTSFRIEPAPEKR